MDAAMVRDDGHAGTAGRGQPVPEVTTAARHPLQAGAPGLLPRLVLVIGVLAGLFTMHGLSAGHGLTAVGAPTTLAPVASGGMAHGTTEHGPATPASHSMTDMAQACVAVLTGAAALLLLLPGPLRALLSRRLPTRQPVLRARGRGLPTARPPDLSVLCVLRT